MAAVKDKLACRVDRSSLARYAGLSIVAAIATIGLKSFAYVLTDSIGLLSDAVESFVNLLGALIALSMLIVAARPADERHPYGHSKAEYFSSGAEGLLIVLAAASIIFAAVQRIRVPQPLQEVGIGLVVSAFASVINFGVARVLLRVGKQNSSITLEADARHLMTDVWTSVAVIAAVGAVALTGWRLLDPLIALLVAANIVWAGVQLMRRSVAGLMDTALPAEDYEKLRIVLGKYKEQGIQFHALRTRQAAGRRFVSVHILVPGRWTTHRSHHVAENVERDIRAALAGATVFTHLEPVDDPLSFQDIEMDR